ncbi:hypothetical protein N9O86_01535 [Planktomarina temperata]|nr:hypothetical protein [Planktomarina temperata]
MRFSFKEIRTHAASFARNYADATYEKGETQTFYNDFFAIFGVEGAVRQMRTRIGLLAQL